MYGWFIRFFLFNLEFPKFFLDSVVVGIVYFAVMYYKANRVVDKHRKDVQQKIVNDAYADYIHKKYSKDE